jgi:hypothetical protein
MASGAAVEGRSEPEWRVEETDVLLRELVMRHSRNCPLLELTPHLQERLTL